MPKSRTKIERIRLALDLLRPHPLQPYYYGGVSEQDDAALAADLREGQRDPIEVLPSGNKAGLPAYTILDGHRRARLLAANGETEADVVIRHDLADANAESVEVEFLGFNAIRRQLHAVEQARIEVRRAEIRYGRPRGGLRQEERAAVRELLAKKLQMKPRNASRYVRLAHTPIEVQCAVREGRLNLDPGSRVCDVPKHHEEIAERIRSGEDPETVVAEYLPIGHRKPNDAFAAFVRSLERAIANFHDHTDRVGRGVIARQRAILECAYEIIAQLLARCGDATERDITDAWEDTDRADGDS